jgi:hypothetical protein
LSVNVSTEWWLFPIGALSVTSSINPSSLVRIRSSVLADPDDDALVPSRAGADNSPGFLPEKN